MKGNRWLTFAGYVLAAYLIFVPLWETGLAVFPPGFGDPPWRFGAMGLLSQALMTPLLGLMIAMGIALRLGHRKTTLLLSVVCAFGAVVLLIAVPVFVMDGLTMRGTIGVEGQGNMTAVTGASLIKVVLAVLITSALALGGWRVTRNGDAPPDSPTELGTITGRTVASGASAPAASSRP